MSVGAGWGWKRKERTFFLEKRTKNFYVVAMYEL